MAEPGRRSLPASGACIVIPARFASTRFPGKPLATIRGPSGTSRTLIEWSWRAACRVPAIDRVLVATDDRRIADEVERFGGSCVITPSECANGTERCAAVADALEDGIDFIVNFQGDAPLTPAPMVQALVQCLSNDDGAEVATPAIPCAGPSLDHLLEEQRQGRVGGTTLVFDRRGRALYFSKNVIPHGAHRQDGINVWLHLGIYAYTRSALANYRRSPPSQAELAEGLEQLRFLDHGIPVRIVTCPAPEGTMAELNNPEDVAVIEQELQRRGQR